MKAPTFFSGASHPTIDRQDGRELVNTLIGFCVAVLMIALPVFTHIVNPMMAIALALALAAILANWIPAIAVVGIFVAALFQNFFVSLVSPHLTGSSDFNIIRGYNFVLLVAVWSVTFLTYVLRWRGQNPALDQIMTVTIGLLGAIFLYFLLGAAQNPLGAVIYLRSIAGAMFLFQICLLLFSQFPIRITYAFNTIVFFLLLFGYVELLFREEWLDWTNGRAYFDLTTKDQRESGLWDRDARVRGVVVKGFLDAMTVDLFNTPLLSDFKITVVRLLGPNIHAISYAYGIAFFIIYSAYRGSFLTALLLVPLLIFANAKGAVILLILVSAGWVIARVFGPKPAFFMLGGLIVCYIILGIIIGLKIGDYHVLGFMGGVHNFLDNPIGHGIGAGGNLGTNFSSLDWSEYQAAGRTPIAIESAVGVMLFQIGIVALVYIGICIWLAWQTIKVASLSGHSYHLAAGFSLLVVLANGIFQEEALFSPPAFGLILALNGIILGSAIRTGAKR